MSIRPFEHAIYDILDTETASKVLDIVEAETSALRAELEEARAQAEDAHQLRERLNQAETLHKTSAEKERILDKALSECCKYMGREIIRLNLLISEGLQVYESNNKFRLRQVMDACTIGKSYDTAREAIDAALTEGISECQCKGEICG